MKSLQELDRAIKAQDIPVSFSSCKKKNCCKKFMKKKGKYCKKCPEINE